MPYRPVGEIILEEAYKLRREGYAYYEAYFNDDGLITKSPNVMNKK